VERNFLEPWEDAGKIKATTVACFYERQVKKTGEIMGRRMLRDTETWIGTVLTVGYRRNKGTKRMK
jgi:hypothetical protein